MKKFTNWFIGLLMGGYLCLAALWCAQRPPASAGYTPDYYVVTLDSTNHFHITHHPAHKSAR